jgi:hypothetical protein
MKYIPSRVVLSLPCTYMLSYSKNAVLSGYITTLKNKQKLDVSSEGPSSRVTTVTLLTLDEGPSLETSSICLFFKVVI